MRATLLEITAVSSEEVDADHTAPLHERRLMKCERRHIGIEGRLDAQRDGRGARTVAEPELPDDRDSQRDQTIADQGVYGFTVMPRAQGDSRNTVQPSGTQEMGQKAIQPIRLLPDVLKYEDAAGDVRTGRMRADLGSQESKAATDGHSGSRPWCDRVRLRPGQLLDGLGLEQGCP